LAKELAVPHHQLSLSTSDVVDELDELNSNKYVDEFNKTIERLHRILVAGCKLFCFTMDMFFLILRVHLVMQKAKIGFYDDCIITQYNYLEINKIFPYHEKNLDFFPGLPVIFPIHQGV
jgi:hypothetical protein